MRTLFASLALAATLSACVSAGGTVPGTPAADWGHSGERLGHAHHRPLEAQIVPTSRNGLSFILSRPAHVAVFEVIPGQGVGLVYPAYGGQREMLGAGYHNPLMGRDNSFRWAYRGATPYTRTAQPRYIYLIASERPLDIGEFVRNPTALRGTLGLPRFASWNAHRILDDLDALVVRGVGPDQWTSDLYVIWPEPRLRDSYAQQQVVVRCSDGRTVLVPLRYAAVACPNDARRGARPAAGDSTREDEDQERVIRRRPPPTGEVERDSDEESDPARRQREVRPRRPEPSRAEPQAEPRRVEPRAEPRPTEPQRVEPSSRAEPRSVRSEPRASRSPERGATGDPQR